MSLPHILLGLLKYKPNTGYQIKTAFQRSINFFWDVSLPQIYRTLNTMEKNGWLKATVEHQDGGPSKKKYCVTPEGENRIQSWLETKPEPTVIKDELLAKIFFGRFTDPDILVQHIKERKARAQGFLEMADSDILSSMEEYQHKIKTKGHADFWGLTLDYGIRRAQTTIEWCDHAIEMLEQK